jgi:DNA-binding transcriptional regulator GbsR (MarR family)
METKKTSYRKEYYDANKDAFRTVQKRYYDLNRDRILERRRAKSKENRENKNKIKRETLTKTIQNDLVEQ